MSAEPPDFLKLLLDGAPLAAYDEALADLEPAERELWTTRRDRALRVREQMEEQRRREAELAALYETANDLTAIRDLDEILGAIVRRARQLLRADMTYLSLNDEGEGASYMKVTDGALTSEFARLRLPLGTGLLGLVAQTGEPYFTEDYQADERFVHRGYIDEAVAGEQIRAILGVPLTVDGVVIGALLAVHRSVRRFPAHEVTLLTSFAAHAAVALQNARLFERTTRAVADLDAANRELTQRSRATERAATAHDLLTRVVVEGVGGQGGIDGVRRVLAEVLGGELVILGPDVVPPPSLDLSEESLAEATDRARSTGRAVTATDPHTLVAVAAAGDDHLATLIHHATQPLDETERRTLERGALVTSLLLLFTRVAADAEDRVRGELLHDLLRGDHDVEVLRERVARQGAKLDGATQVVVAQVAEAPADQWQGSDLADPATDLRRLARIAADLAREAGGVGGEHEGSLVLLAPASSEPSLAHRFQSRLGDPATTGLTIGHTEAASLAQLARAHHEAQATAAALRALGRAGTVATPGELGVARFLLDRSDSEHVAEFMRAALGPLLDYDERRRTELVATLDAWLSNGQTTVATAKALHVHANTVAQRLERITELLGDWRNPGRLLDLQIALQWRRLQ